MAEAGVVEMTPRLGMAGFDRDAMAAITEPARLEPRCRGNHPLKSGWLWTLMIVLFLVTNQLLAQQNTDTAQQTNTPSAQTAAQNPAEQTASPSAPAAITNPPFTGPLQPPTPISFEAGPLGKLDFDGVGSAMGVWQGNHVAGDDTTHPAINNGMIFFQKADGWWQFYVQAGAYNVLSLGSPFIQTDQQISDLWSPVPVAYLKFGPTKTTSVQIGSLPTLLGAEYTFDFQNMNIERGLLWDQENAIDRGIQINQTLGKLTASFSWNDGFYSNRYSWLSGSLTYAKGPHSLSFQAMGNLGETSFPDRSPRLFKTTAPSTLLFTRTRKGSGSCSPTSNTATFRLTRGSGSRRERRPRAARCC